MQHKIKMLRLLIILIFLSSHTYGQKKSFAINGHQFIFLSKKVKNEWGSFDKIRTLYRIYKNTKKNVLKYYEYQDEGGDCNNLFWNRGRYEIRNDSIIVITHYFQKTGADPIPEWRKQIYRVNRKGDLVVLYDKYKYYQKTVWTNQ